jgi:hypothetical protein
MNNRKKICIYLFFSELAQKSLAERVAKRALHQAGVAKKKEIIAKSAVIKSDRQVNFKKKISFEIFLFSFRHVSKNLKMIYKKLKMN